MDANIVRSETLFAGNWLKFEKISYNNTDGVEHSWESVSRVKGCKAVAIIATLVPSNRLLLIRQFRPPVGGFVIEFPAGLINEKETREKAALRELYEETGYSGELKHITDFLYSSPGMSDESIALAMVEIDEEMKNNKNVEPQFDGAEEIESFLVEEDELEDFIELMQRNGDGVDSKVISYLLGRKMYKSAKM